MTVDTNENEDICLDKEELKEALPKADTPIANTTSRVGSGQRSVTQEVLMTVIDISGVGFKLTPQSTASRKFPKQFFTKMAAAVLDGDTGKLLEYRHLMKNPKYKEIGGNSFGNEIGLLVQGMHCRVLKEKATNTMFFIKQDEIPNETRRYVMCTQLVGNYRDQKK